MNTKPTIRRTLFKAALAVAGIAAAILFTRRYISKMLDRKIFVFQNDLIQKHCDEVRHIYYQMRGWRHDYHSHMQILKVHMAQAQYAKLGAYLNKLEADLATVDTVLKTGNVMLDAILNSKISLALSKNIAVDATAAAPEGLSVSEIDLCVIISNLLDNATEACLRLPAEAERRIRIYVDVFNAYLYVSVTNTMPGKLEKGAYPSHKRVSVAQHGFGLMRIDTITAKYGGYVNRQHEDGVFVTEVMLPIAIGSTT